MMTLNDFSFQNAHTMLYATYKIVYEGYPVLTIATSDKSKQFHPFGLAITYEEQTELYYCNLLNE